MCKLFYEKGVNVESIERNIRKQTQLKHDGIHGPSSYTEQNVSKDSLIGQHLKWGRRGTPSQEI